MYLSEQFEIFASHCTNRSKLYEALSIIVSNDRDILELAAAVPKDRSVPLVFFGTIHSLLLKGVEHPLKNYYKTCTNNTREPDVELIDIFKNFCQQYREDLKEDLRSNITQTNCIGRCATLYPAVIRVCRRENKPVSLVEIGASAGLNLFLDKYSYVYGQYGKYGNKNAPVEVRSTINGGKFPDDLNYSHELQIEDRIGIDINPLNVCNEQDVHWLKSLIWPDQEHRFNRIDNAIEFAKNNLGEFDLQPGKATEALPRVVANIPKQHHVCVFNTQTLYQLNEDALTEFREMLIQISCERSISWISGENLSTDSISATLRYARLDKQTTKIRPTILAEYDSHGSWIKWIN